MKPLPIVWQRLVSASGTTCPRCNDTGQEIRQACDRLKAALTPLGIEPILETREISEAAFQSQPTESNRIWIAGKSMEEWLAGSVGSSRCCEVCGDAECRTVEVDGTTFETIPQSLVVRAALIAASQMLDSTSG